MLRNTADVIHIGQQNQPGQEKLLVLRGGKVPKVPNLVFSESFITFSLWLSGNDTDVRQSLALAENFV